MEGDFPVQDQKSDHVSGDTQAEAQNSVGEGDAEPSVKPKLHAPLTASSPISDSDIPLTAGDIGKLAERLRQQVKIDLSSLHESNNESSDVEGDEQETGAEDEDHTDAESDDEVDYDTIPDYDRQDIENLFTNLYCYSNLLESIAEDNDNDHFRFLHFIKQVEHKQSELIRVSDALPECDNLAIDLAYNLVVTSSYMNLMFTWDSGKRSLGDEISTLALNSAEYLLLFAHRSQQSELVKDCVEDMLSVMQKFCLVNVVEQAKVLDGLSEYQRRILCKIEKVISCWDDGYANISVSSVNSEDLLNSSSEEEIEQTVKEAKEFGVKAYNSATQKYNTQNTGCLNTNNNADGPDVSDSELETDRSHKTETSPSKTDKDSRKKPKDADMDDLILFSNVNPYDHIWKMFTDNADLVRLFKIKKTTRPEILETLPNCFQVLLSLENMGHNILSNCVAQEGMNVHQSFQLLQEIIGAERIDEDGVVLLHKMMLRFCDIERRLAAMFDWCEKATMSAIGDLKVTSDDSSSCGDSEGEAEEEEGVAAEGETEATEYHDPADMV